MPTSWEKADGAVERLTKQLMRKYHADLHDAGVTFTVLMATPDEDEGPPLLINGYPQAAIVRKTSTRNRVAGLADFEINVDAREWEKMGPDTRRALLDHELEHVELVMLPEKKGGGVARDCAGRPRLALKNHDWQLGGFRVIAQRHRRHALEVQNAQAFADTFGQFVFGFAGPAPVVAGKRKAAADDTDPDAEVEGDSDDDE